MLISNKQEQTGSHKIHTKDYEIRKLINQPTLYVADMDASMYNK